MCICVYMQECVHVDVRACPKSNCEKLKVVNLSEGPPHCLF